MEKEVQMGIFAAGVALAGLGSAVFAVLSCGGVRPGQRALRGIAGIAALAMGVFSL